MNARRKTCFRWATHTSVPHSRRAPDHAGTPARPGRGPDAGRRTQAPVRDAAISAAMLFAVTESGPGSAANTARR